MSTKAINWALEQEGLSPTIKIVLIAMADSCSDQGKSFSSNKTLCRITGHSKEETISEAQKDLCELNLIADTGKRVGTTGRVKVFQFHPDACKEDPSNDDLDLFDNPPPNGVLKESPIPRQSPANPPPIPRLTETPILKDKGIRNKAIATSLSFSDGWIAAYKQRFNEDYIYECKDGVCISRLLRRGITPEYLLEVACKAWEVTDEKRFWNCVHNSKTVSKFVSAFNEIKLELKSVPQKSYFGKTCL